MQINICVPYRDFFASYHVGYPVQKSTSSDNFLIMCEMENWINVLLLLGKFYEVDISRTTTRMAMCTGGVQRQVLHQRATPPPPSRVTLTTRVKKKTLAGLAGACDLLRPWTRCPRDLVLLIGPFTQEYPRLLWPHLRPTLHIHEAVRWLGPMLLGSGQRRLRAGPFPFCSPCWHRLARRSPRGASFFFDPRIQLGFSTTRELCVRSTQNVRKS